MILHVHLRNIIRCHLRPRLPAQIERVDNDRSMTVMTGCPETAGFDHHFPIKDVEDHVEYQYVHHSK